LGLPLLARIGLSLIRRYLRKPFVRGELAEELAIALHETKNMVRISTPTKIKLLSSIVTCDTYAWDLASAIRGPDNGKVCLKDTVTHNIRLLVARIARFNKYPVSFDFDAVARCVESVGIEDTHFIDHAMDAVIAIMRVLGVNSETSCLKKLVGIYWHLAACDNMSRKGLSSSVNCFDDCFEELSRWLEECSEYVEVNR